MSEIIERLDGAFKRLEQWDLHVGDVWLHPNQVVELAGEPAFDLISSLRVRDAFLESKGAPYVGMLFGARVFSSVIVVENHVVLVPVGLDAKLTDGAACMPF